MVLVPSVKVRVPALPMAILGAVPTKDNSVSQPEPIDRAVSVPAPAEVRLPIFIPVKVPAAGPEVVGEITSMALMVPPVTMAPEAGTKTLKPEAVSEPPADWVITGKTMLAPLQAKEPAVPLVMAPAVVKSKPL